MEMEIKIIVKETEKIQLQITIKKKIRLIYHLIIPLVFC